MAPVTRPDEKASNGTVIQHDKVCRRVSGPLNVQVMNFISHHPQYNGGICSLRTTESHKAISRSTDAGRMRLVQCTVHLDQICKNGELKAMPKLKQSYQQSTEGRLVHPLVFKPFSAEMLNEVSPDGNVAFIMELESLLTRFPRCSLLTYPTLWTVELLITRRTRNVDRYVTGLLFDENDDVENRVAKIVDLTKKFSINVKIYVDVIPSDFRFFKKNWVREFVSHDNCTIGGELCTNLMTRDVAWDAFNF